MKILLCGANGFIGRHLCVALERAGHTLVRGVHQSRSAQAPNVVVDYTQDTDVETWVKRLLELGPIDVVINAVGLFRESADVRFATIHRDAPIALFKAAERCGVKGIVQISALAGGEATPYLQSKREADAYLQQSRSPHLIVRPSLVVGLDGASSRFFRCLASLPIIGLPGAGQQVLQPVHIDDLSQAIVVWVNDNNRRSQVLNAVGPQPITYRDMLANYRAAMRLPKALYLPIPMGVMRLVARVVGLFPASPLTTESLLLLERGSAAPATEFAALLGSPPKGPAQWFAGIPARLLAAEAITAWSLTLLRITLAQVWFVTGLLSLGIYPVKSSLGLLAPLGLHGALALVVLYSAALLDLLMAAFTVLRPSRGLWLSQIVLIVGYSALIACALPEFYLHPFGPILKNLPILAVLFTLYAQQTHQGEPA